MWRHDKKGAILIMTLVFTSIFIIIGGGLISLINQQQKLNRIRRAKAQSLHIAEAGINYYRWHLAHDSDDYSDGTGDTTCNPCGPYTHDYPEGIGAIGQFEIEITPPEIGSTVVTIKSTGWVTGFEDYQRNVVAKYGLTSWAKYAVVANSDMRFGDGTIAHGPIHSNGGVRFDGIAYNVITSSQNSYDDPDHTGDDEFGVHTHKDVFGIVDDSFGADPTPPAAVPSRLDVFYGGREFPVPTVDFNAITMDLANLEVAADDDGLHLNKSNRRGWHIQLHEDDTLTYQKVRSTTNCSGTPTGYISRYQGNPTTANFPNNGIIFVSDNVWIDGKINDARLTIVAAEDPLASGNADIWINNDLEYTNYDGTDAIGLVAQNDINVGLYTVNDGEFSGTEDEMELRIDGALIAQKGRVGRHYYSSSCSSTYYLRNTISVYGTIATNQRYGFAWVCGGSWCSGFETRNLTFDNNLTYAPPPSFPTTDTYDFISWDNCIWH